MHARRFHAPLDPSSPGCSAPSKPSLACRFRTLRSCRVEQQAVTTRVCTYEQAAPFAVGSRGVVSSPARSGWHPVGLWPRPSAVVKVLDPRAYQVLPHNTTYPHNIPNQTYPQDVATSSPWALPAIWWPVNHAGLYRCFFVLLLHRSVYVYVHICIHGCARSLMCALFLPSPSSAPLPCLPARFTPSQSLIARLTLGSGRAGAAAVVHVRVGSAGWLVGTGFS